jgi:hypothetical protein
MDLDSNLDTTYYLLETLEKLLNLCVLICKVGYQAEAMSLCESEGIPAKERQPTCGRTHLQEGGAMLEVASQAGGEEAL